MKLFQQLLVAPAALGLMAPMAVNATELNLDGVSDYSGSAEQIQNFSDVYPTDWAFKSLTDLAKGHGCAVSIPSGSISRYEAAALLNKCLGNVAELNTEERRLVDEFAPELAVLKGRIDGLESRVSEFEAGQFSATTTMSGTAVFTTGSVTDGGGTDVDDALHMRYGYAIDLNTSFNGDDLLYTGIEAGNNGTGPLSNMDSAINSTGTNTLEVTSLFYSFPLGIVDVTVGPLMDQDDVIAATLSAYSDSFRLSALPFSAEAVETGPGVAVAYENDNGFVASISFVADEGHDATGRKGIAGEDAADVTTVSVGYSDDNWGVGAIIRTQDGDDSLAQRAAGTDTVGGDSFGMGGYWTPDKFPATISVAYDSDDPESGNDATDVFVGIDYEVGPGVLSIGYNNRDVDGGSGSDQVNYEVSYTYSVTDGITITPGIFMIEETTAGSEDDTGIVVETVFSF